MIIYCCECKQDIEARITSGAEVYPHRPDLKYVPIWKCDACGNYVGCHKDHHDESKRLKPLGVIPNKEIKAARGHIHRVLDPIWERKRLSRKAAYKKISEFLGYEYHTAELRDIETCRKVYRFVRDELRSN